MASPVTTVGRRPTDDSQFVAVAEEFVEVRGRPALVYFLSDESIGTSNVLEVRDILGDRRFGELDFVIHSTGGDIHAAYQLVSFLRARTETLFACVPLFARSAATLLCIGAHRIVLDELSSLGPLDAQVYDREASAKEGTALYVSALTPFKTLERLGDLSLETLQASAEMLYDHGVQRTDDVLKYGMEFVRVTMGPLFEKQRAERLGEFNQMLAVGEEYAHRLLRDSAGLSEEQRRRLVRRLVHDYPSHEYIVDYQELQDIGLAVELLNEREQPVMRKLARHVDRRTILLVGTDRSAAVEEVAVVDREVEEADSQLPTGAKKPAGDLREASVESRYLREDPPRRAGQANPWRKRPV